MMKYVWIVISLFTLSCQAQIISSNTIVKITEYEGKERAWIHDIQFVNDSLYFVKGAFTGDLNLGDTLIAGGEDYTFFIALFKNDTLVNTLVLDNVEYVKLYSDKNGNFVLTGNSGFGSGFVSYYDSTFKRRWKKVFSLTNNESDLSIFSWLDIEIDDNNNVYGLFLIEGGDLKCKGQLFSKKGDLLLKFNSTGDILFAKQISKPRAFTKLTLTRGKIFATYQNSFSAFDVDRGNPIVNEKLVNESITADVVNNGYYRAATNNTKPEKFSVVKYDNLGNQLFKNEIVECKGQKRTGELVDFDKERLLFISTDHIGEPAGSGSSDYTINCFVVEKKNLLITDSWTIKCDNIHEDVIIKKHGKVLYIGFTYFKSSRFGDIVLHNDREFPFNESFAIVEYKIN